MTKSTTFDVIVIGSGSAGFSAIESAVQQGVSVCVIERGRFGGECPNSACIPSKALLRSASVYRRLGHAREYGIDAPGRAYEWKNLMKYQQEVVETITGGGASGDRYLALLKKLKVAYRVGSATFLDANRIDVEGEILIGKTIIIATGTVDFIPPIPGIEEVPYWSWKDALQAKKQPKSLAIIGAGPVGCEIATFYASFGTRVVLLQASPMVLEREDEELSMHALEALTSVGVEVVVNAQIKELVNGRVGVIGLKVVVGAQEQMFAVERVVMATGKRSNVQDLHLDIAGVALDSHGNLKTNKEQRTSVSHIFGAGDVDGGMQFTHTAHNEGWIAGYNAVLSLTKTKKKPLVKDERVVPRVTFLDPEVASVGMTEAEVKKQYAKALVGRYDVGNLGRAVTDHSRSGVIKLVAHPKTRKLLGAHIMCPHAGELIHETALAMYLGATVDKLADMIHAFPTYSEGIKAAASNAVSI